MTFWLHANKTFLRFHSTDKTFSPPKLLSSFHCDVWQLRVHVTWLVDGRSAAAFISKWNKSRHNEYNIRCAALSISIWWKGPLLRRIAILWLTQCWMPNQMGIQEMIWFCFSFWKKMLIKQSKWHIHTAVGWREKARDTKKIRNRETVQIHLLVTAHCCQVSSCVSASSVDYLRRWKQRWSRLVGRSVGSRERERHNEIAQFQKC